MKSLLIIWGVTILSTLGAIAYINAELNRMVVHEPTVQSIPLDTDSAAIQPAKVVPGNFVDTYDPHNLEISVDRLEVR